MAIPYYKLTPILDLNDDANTIINSVNESITHKKTFKGKIYQNQEVWWLNDARRRYNVTIQFTTYEEMNKVRNFFSLVEGRAKPFFATLPINKVHPLNELKVGTQVLYVDLESYIDTYIKLEKPLYLFFNEAKFATKVTRIEKNFEEAYGKIVFKMTLEDSLPADIINNCCSVEELIYCRFDNDNLSIKYYDLVRGEINLTLYELSKYEAP
jgi:hypothetical protein